MNLAEPRSRAPWLESSDGARASAQQVLLLHGFTGSSASWEAVVGQLAKLTSAPIELYAPSLFGHAPSQLPQLNGTQSRSGQGCQRATPTSFADHTDAIVSWARARGFVRGVICGYSLGGRVAVDLLTRHQTLATAAILISATAGLQDKTDRRLRLQSDRVYAEQLRQKGIAQFLEHWTTLPLFSSQHRLPKSMLAAQQALRESHSAEGLAACLDRLGLAQMPNCWPRLKQIRCPVQAISGASDRKFDDLAQQLVQSLPTARHRRLPGVGHNPLLEAPFEVASEISQCLSGAA